MGLELGFYYSLSSSHILSYSRPSLSIRLDFQLYFPEIQPIERIIKWPELVRGTIFITFFCQILFSNICFLIHIISGHLFLLDFVGLLLDFDLHLSSLIVVLINTSLLNLVLWLHDVGRVLNSRRFLLLWLDILIRRRIYSILSVALLSPQFFANPFSVYYSIVKGPCNLRLIRVIYDVVLRLNPMIKRTITVALRLQFFLNIAFRLGSPYCNLIAYYI